MRIASFLFMTLFLLLFCNVMLLVFTSNNEDKIVNCYDRYGNIIIGQQCFDEGNNLPTKDIKALFIVMNTVIITMCIVLNWEDLIGSAL